MSVRSAHRFIQLNFQAAHLLAFDRFGAFPFSFVPLSFVSPAAFLRPLWLIVLPPSSLFRLRSTRFGNRPFRCIPDAEKNEIFSAQEPFYRSDRPFFDFSTVGPHHLLSARPTFVNKL